MTPISTITGKAYPFGRKNVDTDVIIPAHWLKTISRTGLGRGAFESIRAEPGNLFDAPEYAGAPILIAGDNFGCGSSREHAAWALADMGIACVIAPSFSDIFSGNAFKNGIVTVVLPQDQVDVLMARVLDNPGLADPIHIDLGAQMVTTPFQDRFKFDIDPFRKSCLLGGLDEIGMTMAKGHAISAYEEQLAANRPWLVPVLS